MGLLCLAGLMGWWKYDGRGFATTPLIILYSIMSLASAPVSGGGGVSGGVYLERGWVCL